MKTNLKSVDLNDHIKEKEISEHNIDAVLKLLYMQENVKDETDYNFLYDNTDFYQYEPIPKQPLIEFVDVELDRYGKENFYFDFEKFKSYLPDLTPELRNELITNKGKLTFKINLL